MTNAEKFKCVFGLYATELWAMDEDKMLKWLNAEYKESEWKQGKWVDDGQCSDNFPHHEWHCSECGECVIEIDTPWFKFCPNCGARMEDK